MTVSYWQETAPSEPVTSDAVVVGGGIVGAYAASLLRQAGRDTLLLEARDLASGATGRNAGMVLLGLSDYYAVAVERYGRERARELWQLTARNRERTRDLLRQLDLPYTPAGSLLLAGTLDEAATLEASARLLLADGFNVEYHARDPLGRGFAAGLRQPDDLTINPVQFTRAVAVASGATLLRDCEVYALEPLARGCRVRAKRITVECEHVLLAVNAYAPNLHPYFAGKVAPTRAQMLATAPTAPLLSTAVYANWGYEYIRQLADGRVLLGGGRRRFATTEVGYHDTTTPDVQQALAEFLHRHFPEVDAPVTHRWSGVMGFTRDGIPLVGRLPDLPGVGFAVGFTGHGLGIGLMAAERAVELLLHDTPAGIFDATRCG